jgi:predicted nucleic acid-binding protein
MSLVEVAVSCGWFLKRALSTVMARMKLYIETTVPNFLFADDAPEKKSATEEFFRWLKICRDELFTSALVLEELEAARQALRSKLLRAMNSVPCEVLPITREQRGLASVYVTEGVIPARYTDDAIHAAVCVLNRIDCLVTWNMKHLANFRANRAHQSDQSALRIAAR